MKGIDLTYLELRSNPSQAFVPFYYNLSVQESVEKEQPQELMCML